MCHNNLSAIMSLSFDGHPCTLLASGPVMSHFTLLQAWYCGPSRNQALPEVDRVADPQVALPASCS